MSEQFPEEEIEATVERIRPLLAGKPAPIQGAVLADLLAMWIHGHWLQGASADEQFKVWGELLDMHIDKVTDLLMFYANTA